jgi:hypothetical protein
VNVKYAQIHDAAQSCRHCGMLEKIILAVVDGHLPTGLQVPQDDADRARILDKLELGPKHHIYYKGDGGLRLAVRGEWISVELFRDPGEHSGFRIQGFDIPEPIQYGPRTDSDRALSSAEAWLRRCIQEHQTCGRTASTYYPKRLLDLRGGRIQLIETGHTEIKDPYVCLSHRWGDESHQRLQSTVKTIQKHMHDIPWEDLPKTFQDTVVVCRRLSVNYLWIDTLCILQEVPGLSDQEKKETALDFAKENSDMGNIYQNSHFTICANITTSMESGLFSARNWTSCGINLVDDDGNDVVVHIRERLSHEGPPTDLETRGWAFQEYVLPSRILGFESFDISWRCKEAFDCECGELARAANWRVPLAEYGRYRPDLQTAQKWWANIVNHYSKRFLTNERDKLPALSGLAQIYHEVSDDIYLAGIWKSSLPHRLCWYYLQPGGLLPGISTSRRPRKFRAPSWSWASIDVSSGGECCFWGFTRMEPNPLAHEGVLRVVCTLYEASCELKTSDPFGEVLSGFIELEAMLIPARISANYHWEYVGASSAEVEMAWTLNDVGNGSDVLIFLADCNLEDIDIKLGDKVYCVPILESSSEWEQERGCLVLKHLQQKEYQRIGFCILAIMTEDWNHPELSTLGQRANPLNLLAAENAQNGQSHCLQHSAETKVRFKII